MQPVADRIFFSFSEKVFQGKLAGVHFQFPGDHVGMGVDGKGGRYRARTAIVPAGNGIRVNLKKLEKGVVDTILSAGVMPRGQRSVGLKRAVGAARMHRAQRARQDAAIAFHAAANGDDRRMRRIACRQFLGVSHHHFDGVSRLAREEVGHG